VKKPSADELAAAHDRGDWNTLWLAARPLVKFTIKNMIRRGEIDPARWIDEDLLQQGMLSAGLAVRSWNTLEGAFSTWVSTKVRGYLREFRDNAVRHGFTGQGDPPILESLQEEVRAGEGDDEEIDETKQDALVYPNEVFLSQETAAERDTAMRLLSRLGPKDAELMRRLCGIGCESQTLREIAMERGVSVWSLWQASQRLGKLLESK